MLEKLDQSTGNILGYKVIGKLTRDDYKTVTDAFEALGQDEDDIRLLLDLEDFKGIFWLEYAHRVLGRLIGIIFLLPLIYFFVRKRISRPLAPKLVFMFVLGGLQGLLGWYMVKSGLSQDPHVSQYRLTAHLGMAFLIYGYIFWVAL